MKYLISFTVIIISMQILSVCSYAQQYEDVVYLKNGGIVHGTIMEQIVGESVKIKTADGNFLIFKMDEIEKIAKEEVVIKKEEIKNIKNDSIKNKEVKTVLKTESKEKEKKELISKNSLTIQPIGLFTLLTNIEYDKALSNSFSAGLKFSFMTFLARSMISFTAENQVDADNAEITKKSLSGWGIGGHIRFYTGSKALEHFFLGIAVERLSISYDKVVDDITKATISETGNLIRVELEIGNRIKLSSKEAGFTILWTLGGGVGFGSRNTDTFTIPLGSIGLGIGYSF